MKPCFNIAPLFPDAALLSAQVSKLDLGLKNIHDLKRIIVERGRITQFFAEKYDKLKNESGVRFLCGR